MIKTAQFGQICWVSNLYWLKFSCRIGGWGVLSPLLTNFFFIFRDDTDGGSGEPNIDHEKGPGGDEYAVVTSTNKTKEEVTLESSISRGVYQVHLYVYTSYM